MSDLATILSSQEAQSADIPAGSRPAQLPRIADAAGYAALKPGTDYLDPEGQKRTKYWRVDPAQPQTYDAIPEGADYLDPEGQKRTKPTSDNVGLGTQTLFDMAAGDPAKQKKILQAMYGDNVRQDSQGFYVTVNGQRLRPSSAGGGITGALTRGAADVVSQALPVAGATSGAAVGGGAGTFGAGPVGTAAGGMAGSALGYAAGKEANRALLALAGFGDEGMGIEKVPGELAEGALFEAGGRVAGRVAGQAAAAAKYGARYVAEATGLPRFARYVGGVTPETAARFGPLAERGVHLPPQVAYPAAPILPILSSIGKRYDIDPVTPSLAQYASGEISSTAEALGIPRAELGEPLKRTAEVDYAPAGQALYARYADMLHASNADVAAKFDAAEAAARGGGTGAEVGRQSALAEAQKALEANQAITRGLVEQGFQDLRGAIAQLQSGLSTQNPGDLVRTLSGKITAARQAVGLRYQDLYSKWDQLFGSRVADVSAPAQAARDFLRDLPEDVQRNHPALVRAITKLDQAEEEEGVAPDITTGQLRHIRTMLGDLANWQTLAPAFKNGQIKYFRGVIDQSLRENLPEPGVKMLDTLDSGYRTDMAPFHDPTAQKLVDWTEANMPPGAGTAARTVIGAEPETRAYLRGLAGAPVWDAVVGADMQAALDASKSIYEGEIDGAKFISEFEKRDRLGVLADYPPEVVAKFRKQAQYVSEMTDGGKAPLPMATKRGDTFSQAMQNAYDAAQRIEKLSKDNPIKAMEDELKNISAQRKAALKGVTEEYSTDPLGQMLTNPNAMLTNVAQRIVRDPQLLETASKRFGVDSPEFKLLSRTYIKDVLTHPDVYGLKGLSDRLSKLTRQQQEAIFGGSTDDVILFAQNVRDILAASEGTDAGKSIIASTAVTHPASTPIPGMHALRGVPTPLVRIPMSVVLKHVINAYTNPTVFRFISGALRGPPEEQALAKALIRRYMQRGGVAGAALGSAFVGPANDNPAAAPPTPTRWQDQYQQRYGQ